MYVSEVGRQLVQFFFGSRQREAEHDARAKAEKKINCLHLHLMERENRIAQLTSTIERLDKELAMAKARASRLEADLHVDLLPDDVADRTKGHGHIRM